MNLGYRYDYVVHVRDLHFQIRHWLCTRRFCDATG